MLKTQHHYLGDGAPGPLTLHDWLEVAARRRHDVDLSSATVRPRTLRHLDGHLLGHLAGHPNRSGSNRSGSNRSGSNRSGSDRAGSGGAASDGAVAGERTTRRGIAHLFGDEVAPEDVVVTHGLEQALRLAVTALVRRGDHVVVATPSRRQAWELPTHLGADVTMLNRVPGRPLEAGALLARIRPRTKVLFLDVGALAGDVDALFALAREREIWIVADEDHLLDHRRSVAARYERGVSLGSLASVQGLPWLALGWIVFGAAGGELVMDAVADKAWSTGANLPLTEHVARGVLAEAHAHRARYTYLLEAAAEPLAETALDVVRDSDAPYAWIRLPVPSREFAEHLLGSHRVLVVPGEAAGTSLALRINLTVPRAELAEGLRRIAFAVGELG